MRCYLTTCLLLLCFSLPAEGQLPVHVVSTRDCDGDGTPDAFGGELYYLEACSTQCMLTYAQLVGGAKCGQCPIPPDVRAKLIQELRAEPGCCEQESACQAYREKITKTGVVDDAGKPHKGWAGVTRPHFKQGAWEVVSVEPAANGCSSIQVRVTWSANPQTRYLLPKWVDDSSVPEQCRSLARQWVAQAEMHELTHREHAQDVAKGANRAHGMIAMITCPAGDTAAMRRQIESKLGAILGQRGDGGTCEGTTGLEREYCELGRDYHEHPAGQGLDLDCSECCGKEQ